MVEKEEKNNEEEFGELLFTDSFSGIEKLRVEKFSLKDLIMIFLFIFLVPYAIVALCFFITSSFYFGLLLFLLAGVVLMFVFVLEMLATPVQIYSNGIEVQGFISFEMITDIYCEQRSKESYRMFSFKLGSGSLVESHVKDHDAFIATLKQIYGEKKWNEIFEIKANR